MILIEKTPMEEIEYRNIFKKKCKNLFNIGARKFHFPKYSKSSE